MLQGYEAGNQRRESSCGTIINELVWHGQQHIPDGLLISGRMFCSRMNPDSLCTIVMAGSMYGGGQMSVWQIVVFKRHSRVEVVAS